MYSQNINFLFENVLNDAQRFGVWLVAWLATNLVNKYLPEKILKECS